MVNPNQPVGLGLNNALNNVNRDLNRTLDQLASGSRINRFAEDAAGGSIAEGLEAAVRGLQQEVRNDQNAVSRLQTQDGGYQAVTEDLQRVRELRVQLDSDNLDENAREAIRDEIVQTVESIRTTVANTEYNGEPVLEAGSALQQVLEGDSELDTVDAAIEEVASQRAEGGAQVNRLESQIANRQVATENVLAAQSRIEDLDFARGVSDFIQQQIREESSIRVIDLANSLNRQNVSALLGGL